MDLRYWLNPDLFSPTSSGRRNATAFLRQRYNGSIGALSSAWSCQTTPSDFNDLSSCLSPYIHKQPSTLIDP